MRELTGHVEAVQGAVRERRPAPLELAEFRRRPKDTGGSGLRRCQRGGDCIGGRSLLAEGDYGVYVGGAACWDVGGGRGYGSEEQYYTGKGRLIGGMDVE